jgi:Skp family chaperone for outer membrane proteins
LLGIGTLAAPDAGAQALSGGLVQSQILTIDSDRLYLDSDFGKAVAQEFDAKGKALAAENRSIEADLTQEERDLTEQRASMDPATFRALADEFDAKVQAIRREQDAKNRALNQELEERRVQFLSAAAPVLEDLMRQTGAAVVLERRMVFLSANAVDITQEAISQLNSALGDGSTPAD